MESIEVCTPQDILRRLSIGKNMIALYPVDSLAHKGLMLSGLAKDISMESGMLYRMTQDPSLIGLYEGDDNDVASLKVLMSTYPYNELMYFAHYTDGELLEENIPEEVR